MKYEWDGAKNQKNKAKHGLSFEDAEKIFPGHASPSKTTAFLTGKND